MGSHYGGYWTIGQIVLRQSGSKVIYSEVQQYVNFHGSWITDIYIKFSRLEYTSFQHH